PASTWIQNRHTTKKKNTHTRTAVTTSPLKRSPNPTATFASVTIVFRRSQEGRTIVFHKTTAIAATSTPTRNPPRARQTTGNSGFVIAVERKDSGRQPIAPRTTQSAAPSSAPQPAQLHSRAGSSRRELDQILSPCRKRSSSRASS